MSFLLRLKISLVFGGKKNYNDQLDFLKEQSVKQLNLVHKVRNYLEEDRLLTSENNLILLELEETLNKEIKVFSSIRI